MGHTRPRYNEKGRQVKRASGKRKITEVDDSNAEILDEEVRKKRRAEVSLFCAFDLASRATRAIRGNLSDAQQGEMETSSGRERKLFNLYSHCSMPKDRTRRRFTEATLMHNSIADETQVESRRGWLTISFAFLASRC